MKSKEVKVFIYATIFLTGLFWGGALLISDAHPLSLVSLKALNATAAGIAILWAIYFSWGWRCPYIRRLIFRPNLNGTWIGQFMSDWKDPNGNGIPPGLFVLVIRQNFFAISIRAFTQNQRTISYVESLVVDGARGTKLLAYLYSERRSESVEHGPRQGAADLVLVEEDTHRVLEGDFWTNARTTGFVRVRQVSQNLHVESIQHACARWVDKSQWISV